MAPPVWTPGQVLASADVNSWFVPLAAVKTVDQPVTASTALVNDTALFLPVAATAVYLFHGFFLFEGNTAANIKWVWTAPAGLTMRYQITDLTITALAANITTAKDTDVHPSGTTATGTLNSAMMLGTVVTTGTAGTLQLQWAQNASNAASTIMHAQSAIALYRIS